MRIVGSGVNYLFALGDTGVAQVRVSIAVVWLASGVHI